MRPYPAYQATGIEWMPQAPAHWRLVPLGLIGDVVNGYPFDSKLFDASIGHPMVRIRDIYSSTTETLFNGEWIDAAAIDTDDVLIGMDGDFNLNQ